MWQANQLMIMAMTLYVFYVAGIFVYVFCRRVIVGSRGGLDGRYYKDYSRKADLPREFLMLERHMDHQFQAPTVFLVTCVMYFAVDAVNMLAAGLAWAFVLSRFVHTYIHLGRNKIYPRAVAYAFGGLMILCMWVQILWIHL